ncbi:hypothetical protein YC2023_081645 [Brassica napus]
MSVQDHCCKDFTVLSNYGSAAKYIRGPRLSISLAFGNVMNFDHTFLWTATYWYPIEKDKLNVSSQPHSSSRLFCSAGSLSKGSDVGLVYPENMLSEDGCPILIGNGLHVQAVYIMVIDHGSRICSRISSIDHVSRGLRRFLSFLNLKELVSFCPLFLFGNHINSMGHTFLGVYNALYAMP